MEQGLFSGRSSQETIHHLTQRAIEEARALSKEILGAKSDEQLSEEISNRYKLTVPKLDWDNKTIEEVSLPPAYSGSYGAFPGQSSTQGFKITIPLSGDRDVLRITPRSSRIITQRVEILGNRIIFICRAPNVDSAVNEYKELKEGVEANFAQLKAEFDALSEHLRRQLRAHLHERREELAERNAALLELKEKLSGI